LPTLLRAGPYRLYMFMSDCVEPHHVHVDGNDGLAKFWLRPVSLAENVGYSPREIHRIRMVVARERASLVQAIDTICERAWR
jgi:hypothetical protein